MFYMKQLATDLTPKWNVLYETIVVKFFTLLS